MLKYHTLPTLSFKSNFNTKLFSTETIWSASQNIFTAPSTKFWFLEEMFLTFQYYFTYILAILKFLVCLIFLRNFEQIAKNITIFGGQRPINTVFIATLCHKDKFMAFLWKKDCLILRGPFTTWQLKTFICFWKSILNNVSKKR